MSAWVVVVVDYAPAKNHAGHFDLGLVPVRSVLVQGLALAALVVDPVCWEAQSDYQSVFLQLGMHR